MSEIPLPTEKKRNPIATAVAVVFILIGIITLFLMQFIPGIYFFSVGVGLPLMVIGVVILYKQAA